MYITYEALQWRIEDLHGLLSGPHSYPPPPPKGHDIGGKYRPTWLIRTSDWQRVPGHEAQNGYCALSYSRRQSGKVVQNDQGEDVIIDKGDHQILKRVGGQLVTQKAFYEELLRQICCDFDIEYLWYDRVCLEQENLEIRAYELRYMHVIYQNSKFTVSMIPELNAANRMRYGSGTNERSNIDVITDTDYSKRVWTVEEAFVSRQVLFIGQNVHMWSNAADIGILSPGSFGASYCFLLGICAKLMEWNVSTILWQSHRCTSTYGHDWVFAVFNMMPVSAAVDRKRYDYDQPLLDLLLYLYSHLAKLDISILCFGESNLHDQWIKYHKPENALLPCWTGIEGMHIPQSTTREGFLQSSFKDYTLDGTSMHVRSDVIPITIELVYNSTDTSTASLFGSPYNSGEYSLCCLDDDSGYKSMKFLISDESEDEITKNLTGNYGLKATHWLPIKEGKDAWINTTSSPTWSGGYLSLTDKSCSQCFILASIRFDLHDPEFEALPVVRQDGNRYKSIGVCFLWNFKSIECEVKVDQQLTIV